MKLRSKKVWLTGIALLTMLFVLPESTVHAGNNYWKRRNRQSRRFHRRHGRPFRRDLRRSYRFRAPGFYYRGPRVYRYGSPRRHYRRFDNGRLRIGPLYYRW